MKPGDTVADFELPDQTGAPRQLSSLLADGPVVLFFYPAAGTPGCTREACHFRDVAAEFAAVGASRVGISVDPVAKQAQFAASHGFDFPLLADTEHKVSETYGVFNATRSYDNRTTFLIDPSGRIVKVFTRVNPNVHSGEVQQALKEAQATP